MLRPALTSKQPQSGPRGKGIHIVDARPSKVRRDRVGTNVQELYRRILWTFSAASSTTSLSSAAQGRVISGKQEGIDIPDLDGRNTLGQRRAQHHHHVPAGVGALPGFEAEM